MTRLFCKQNFCFLKSVFQNSFYSKHFKSDFVHSNLQDHVYLIGINRPEKRNCVNRETAAQLITAFNNFCENENAFVAILYGIGGSFSSGLDLKEIANGVHKDINFDAPMGPTKMNITKPVIAAVDGYAVAGGMELALMCDIRIMEETATMGILNRRFGVPLIDGGPLRLPHLIGLARALDLILTGRKISGREAFEMGLVTRICKKGEAYNKAVELATSLCQLPQDRLKADREALYKFCFNVNQ